MDPADGSRLPECFQNHSNVPTDVQLNYVKSVTIARRPHQLRHLSLRMSYLQTPWARCEASLAKHVPCKCVALDWLPCGAGFAHPAGYISPYTPPTKSLGSSCWQKLETSCIIQSKSMDKNSSPFLILAVAPPTLTETIRCRWIGTVKLHRRWSHVCSFHWLSLLRMINARCAARSPMKERVPNPVHGSISAFEHPQ